MAEAARALGHEYLVLTDHSPRLTVANGLSAERLERAARRRRRARTPSCDDRSASSPASRSTSWTTASSISADELLARLDLVVASVHSKLRMPAAEMTPRMVAAIANPHTDVLGHCTGRMVTGGRHRPPSEFDAEVVFAACAPFGVAVEINSRPERRDPPKRLLRLAIEAGCLVSIDTDAHAPGQLEWQPYGCERAALCATPTESVVNTWTGRPAAGLDGRPRRPPVVDRV